MEPKNFYDEEMKEIVSNLSPKDKLTLIASIFNGLANTLVLYHTSVGIDEEDVSGIIHAELFELKNSLRKRIDSVEDFNPEDEAVDTDRWGDPDPEFTNDARIDLHFLMEDVYKFNG